MSLTDAIALAATDPRVDAKVSAVLLLELGQPLEARFIAALWCVTTETVRFRMTPYTAVREAPSRAWSAADVLAEFGRALQ